MMSSVWMNQLADYSLQGGSNPSKWMWTPGQRAEELETEYFFKFFWKRQMWIGNRNLSGQRDGAAKVRLKIIDGWAEGDKRKEGISGRRYRLFSSLCLSICQDKWHHDGLVWADSARWEVSVVSYGSARGICTGGPSCGNHCSVGRWAGAIRPPASHQLRSRPASPVVLIADVQSIAGGFHAQCAPSRMW